MIKRRFFLGSAAALATLVATPALASTALDSPDAGVLQVGRGGAWLARADDPLAAYFNPAAMPLYGSSVHVGVHVMIQQRCFERRDPSGQPVSPGNGLPPPEGEVCAETEPFPNPQVAAVIRPIPELAIGLALLGPHASGSNTWPETVEGPDGRLQPSPQRCLLVRSEATLAWPTISVGFRVHEQFSIGAGFVWGFGVARFTSFTEAVSPDPRDEFEAHGEVKATIETEDLFIPGWVASVHWQPTERFDVSGWFKWQDALEGSADLLLQSNYWRSGGSPRDEDGPLFSAEQRPTTTHKKDAGSVRIPIPPEARLGMRYHHLRDEVAAKGDARARTTRDPMVDDLFDVELDLTWAHNSVIDNVEIRFPGQIPVVGTPGTVPENGDVPHEYDDVLGVRLGGEFVPVPGVVAVRVGGFFESKAQDAEYLNVDFHGGMKGGIGAGFTLRANWLDISVAYQHTFYGTLDNEGAGAVQGLSGDRSTGSRTRHAVNGGKITSSLDEIAIGGTARF